MAPTDTDFTGPIPDIYERFLVPLIFEEAAAALAARVAAAAPARVLETAAGTGVLTRALAARLAPDAHIVASDLNPAMIATAEVRPCPGCTVDWQAADALALPFPDAAFDAVCCQFGVMFFPDRAAGLAEARRVLAPGGLLAFSTWDTIETNVFADLVTRAAAEEFPDDPPRFLARTPHGYADLERVAADLAAAGLAPERIETCDWVSRAPSPRHPAVAYTQGTPLRNEIEARDPGRLTAVTDRAEALIAGRYGPGAVAAPIRGHIVLARAA